MWPDSIPATLLAAQDFGLCRGRQMVKLNGLSRVPTGPAVVVQGVGLRVGRVAFMVSHNVCRLTDPFHHDNSSALSTPYTPRSVGWPQGEHYTINLALKQAQHEPEVQHEDSFQLVRENAELRTRVGHLEKELDHQDIPRVHHASRVKDRYYADDDVAPRAPPKPGYNRSSDEEAKPRSEREREVKRRRMKPADDLEAEIAQLRRDLKQEQGQVQR